MYNRNAKTVGKINCASERFEVILKVLNIYVNGIPQEVNGRRIEQRTS